MNFLKPDLPDPWVHTNVNFTTEGVHFVFDGNIGGGVYRYRGAYFWVGVPNLQKCLVLVRILKNIIGYWY